MFPLVSWIFHIFKVSTIKSFFYGNLCTRKYLYVSETQVINTNLKENFGRITHPSNTDNPSLVKSKYN